MEHPKVSILCITYGHENYIVETLKGFLMQRYNGPIEIILSNDHSPDNTDQVIKDFLDKAIIPANFEIKYTAHEQNLGMMPNFIWALQQCTGKYIAMCEGDDYWTDPLKLQKQVDFLESNQDYGLVITNLNFYYQENKTFLSGYLNQQSFETNNNLETFLLNKPYMAPCTWLWRKNSIDLYLKDLEKFADGTYFLFAHFLHQSKVHFIDQITAVYRYLPESASHSSSSIKLYYRELSLYETGKYLCKLLNINSILPELRKGHIERLSNLIHSSGEDKLFIIRHIAINHTERLSHILDYLHYQLEKKKSEIIFFRESRIKVINSKSFRLGYSILNPFRKILGK